MQLSKIIRLTFDFNRLVDLGYDFPVERIKVTVEDQYVFDYVTQKTIPQQFDIGYLSEQDRSWFLTQFARLQQESAAGENVGCVQNNGLNLLVAYLLELILQKKFDG